MVFKYLLIFINLLNFTLSWNSIGHSLILRIAEKHIRSDKLKKINNIVGEPITNVGDWADLIKHKPNYKWTEHLHFINIENNKKLNYITDCIKNKCIIGGINNFIWQLIEKKNLNEPIRFLAHLFADIHQPLHCGYKKDLGGNILYVQYNVHNLSVKRNFHIVWDKSMISSRILLDFNNDIDKYFSHLYRISITYMDDESIDPLIIAHETVELLPNVYRNVYENCTLDYQYYKDNCDILDRQLAIAGKRMAILFNTYIE
jgi:hypothetical protein